MAKGILNFAYDVGYLFYTCRVLYHAVILQHGNDGLLSLRRKSCYGFLSPLKIALSSTGFEPTNLRSNDKHATIRPPRTTTRGFITRFTEALEVRGPV
jgi:hypothetical protein